MRKWFSRKTQQVLISHKTHNTGFSIKRLFLSRFYLIDTWPKRILGCFGLSKYVCKKTIDQLTPKRRERSIFLEKIPIWNSIEHHSNKWGQSTYLFLLLNLGLYKWVEGNTRNSNGSANSSLCGDLVACSTLSSLSVIWKHYLHSSKNNYMVIGN